MQQKISSCIKQGLLFLAKEQQKKGIFLFFSAENIKINKNIIKHRSVFPAALILSCLNSFKIFPLAKSIQKKAAAYILSQKSDFWSFNYWERGSGESKKAPYPDDLDDTFCSLAALTGYDSKIINGKVLANAVTLLTATEKKEGGPYFTWLVPQNAAKEWKDIDLAVNSNVGFFLSTQDIELDSLSSLVEEALKKNQFVSPYYCSSFAVVYFISRFYKGKATDGIIKFILSEKRRNGGWGNVLDTAFAVSALLNLGVKAADVEPSMKYLIKNEGEWKKSFPFVELILEGKMLYSGAPALTMAFVLEALGKYQTALGKEKEKDSQEAEVLRIKQDMHERIIERASKIFQSKNKEAKDIFDFWTGKLLGGPKGYAITLLPYEFFLAIRKKKNKINEEMLIDLGASNLLGWIAYSIYDNFYDKEGNSSELPVANLCLLNLSLIFSKAASKNGNFIAIFQETMTQLEAANLWETKNCKFDVFETGFNLPKKLPEFGNYQKLADRSMGHALGVAAILSNLGYKNDSLEMKSALGFFRNYIIAKQLNDDAHDWEEDLRSGNMSPAVVKVIETWKKRNKSKKTIDFEKDIDVLRDIFYREVILDVSKDIIGHVKKARKYLGALNVLSDKSYFEFLLGKEEKSGKMAIEEHRNALDFIQSFNG